MAQGIQDVLTDLVAEYDRLEAVLSTLTTEQWYAASGVSGWTIRDVVIHLAQTEEGVSESLAAPVDEWTTRDRPLDQAIDDQVRGDLASAPLAFARWRSARRASVGALEHADPRVAVRWAAAPLKPRTLATTRLAEHWAHALDICDPLGLPLPDTDRLHHIAWLGHATLPYAMHLAGMDPVEVHCTLDSPSGAVWTFGPPTAAARITGAAGAFCRVGARRLAAEDSGLTVSDPAAAQALRLLRNYAA